MKTVYSEDHRLHDGLVDFAGGRFIATFETPRRAEIVLERVRATHLGDVIAPEDFSLAPLMRIHDAAFLRFLETAYSEWFEVYGDSAARPAIAIGPGMRRKLPSRIGARLAYYAIDASTPITATSWRAARSSANVALTAQALVSKGEHAAFALCRPPGHHAGRDSFGGYCFLNNAAIAAQAFMDGGLSLIHI